MLYEIGIRNGSDIDSRRMLSILSYTLGYRWRLVQYIIDSFGSKATYLKSVDDVTEACKQLYPIIQETRKLIYRYIRWAVLQFSLSCYSEALLRSGAYLA